MRNLTKIKKVIQKANPSIMNLEFGCRIEITWVGGEKEIGIHKGNFLTFKNDYNGELQTNGCGCCSVSFEKKEVKILGRPITIADIRILLKKIAKKYKWTAQHFDCMWLKISEKWNCLDDNLDNQSKPTKQFLIDNLVN